MNTRPKVSLSDIRTMILCEYPLSTEECGRHYYDGDGVTKNIEEAYVCYRVAQYAGNHKVDSLINYIGSKLVRSNFLGRWFINERVLARKPMLHKTKWFKEKREKHGLAADITLYAAMGSIFLVALETGSTLYWNASVSDFASLYIALTLYYFMTLGAAIFAFYVGIESHAKYGKWYLSWALVILIMGFSMVSVPIAVDELPRKIERHFDTLQQERGGVGDPKTWFWSQRCTITYRDSKALRMKATIVGARFYAIDC